MSHVRIPKSRRRNGEQTIETPKGRAIPDKWANHEGARLSAFQPPKASNLRLFLTGEVGEGKTTFGLSIPKACVLDFEHKTSGLPHTAPGTVIFGNGDDKTGPWSLDKYDALIHELIDDAKAGKRYFDMVVFDTLGGFCQLVKDTFTDAWSGKAMDPKTPWHGFEAYGADGAGYGKMNSWIITRITKLQNNGYGWAILAHKKIRTEEDRDGNIIKYIKTDGHPGVVQSLDRSCDYAGSVERVCKNVRTEGESRQVKGRTIKGKGQVVPTWLHQLDLEVQPTDGKARATTRQHVPMLESEIVLPDGKGWDAFVDAYNASVTERTKDLHE